MSEVRAHYISMAAHDLRNPLAVIQTSVSTIQDYSDRMTTEQIQSKYDQVQSSIKIMTDMLNDILTIGKVEAGTHHVVTLTLDCNSDEVSFRVRDQGIGIPLDE